MIDSGFNAFRTLNEVDSDEKFDGIITMEVFEHLREPWKEVNIFFELLKPGGWLCISTPNPYCLNARLRGDKWRQAHYTGHVVFGGSQSLCRIMRDSGFQDSHHVNWYIKYSNSPVKMALHGILQRTDLDGAVRVIGWKPVGIDA